MAYDLARNLIVAISLVASVGAIAQDANTESDWQHIGGDAGGVRYSNSTQITRENVGQLKQAWAYKTGDAKRPPTQTMLMGFHPTPILLPKAAGQHLVFASAFNKIIALDPTTGQERWTYDADVKIGPPGTQYKSRGVSLWHDKTAATGTVCEWRLFMATNDRRLISIDAKDGKPCAGFDGDGVLDLEPLINAAIPATNTGAVQSYAPPTIIGDTVVVGLVTNTKSERRDAPNGAVRGFDARTGALKWTWDPIPRDPKDPAAKTWGNDTARDTGGANVWSFMAADEERDLIFLPTSSSAPDYYGGTRPGDNLYATSLVALRGSTGEKVWHYQIVHHDVWNYDLPAQPILANITREGKQIPVVIQLTKQGLVFTFHRETGEPFFPIVERPVPTDGVPGEVLSPTQPVPTKPAALMKQYVQPSDAWGFTPYDEGWCRKVIETSRHGDMYTPYTTQGSVLPQSGGGVNWGGGAFEPSKNVLVTALSHVPYYFRITPNTGREKIAKRGPSGLKAVAGTPYLVENYPLLSPFGAPCTAPPWGTLVAVDMNEGTIKWEVPLGTLDKLAPIPLALKYGTPIMGGPIVTASGLVFTGGTLDEKFRAFDIETGNELWAGDTPSSAIANPMTYDIDGRQFVVVAAAGHFFMYPQKLTDDLVAFALPEKK